MASISARRLGKELTEIRSQGCPVGTCASIPTSIEALITFLSGINLLQADDFSKWFFSIEVMGESVYPVSILNEPSKRPHSHPVIIKGEVYVLQFRFDDRYPISSPAVQFYVGEGKVAPVHPVS